MLSKKFESLFYYFNSSNSNHGKQKERLMREILLEGIFKLPRHDEDEGMTKGM